jgi:hypothetical protein
LQPETVKPDIKAPETRFTDSNPPHLSINGGTAHRLGRSEGLRYSSPAPWILAIVVSLLLWAIIAWGVWRLFFAGH